MEPLALAADLQRKFAASAGANPLPGAKAAGACEIVVQGDIATKVRRFCGQSNFSASEWPLTERSLRSRQDGVSASAGTSTYSAADMQAGVYLAEAYGVPKTHIHVKAAKK